MIGISAYDMDPHEVVHLARAADAAGFSSLWVAEHLAAIGEYESEHPSHSGGPPAHRNRPAVTADTTVWDPLVLLGAIAGCTQHLRLCTGVYILPARHPMLTARACHTLQQISFGRLVLGIGMGWLREEIEGVGVPYEERLGRFNESVEVIRAAWQGGPIAHRGRYYAIEGLQISERPIDVPLIYAGNGPRALERAARDGDGWFCSSTPPLEEATRLRTQILERRVETHRPDQPFHLVVRSTKPDADIVRSYLDEGFDEVLVWAEQVWPGTMPRAERAAHLAHVARDLGLAPRANADAAGNLTPERARS